MAHRAGLVIPDWRYTGIHGCPSIHSPAHTGPTALWRPCQLRSTISSAFMNMYCWLATSIQKKKKKEKKVLFQTMLTLTRAHDFFQTPNVLGSQIPRLEKKLMAFDFHVPFCRTVNRGLCRRLHCKERIWRGKTKQMSFQPDIPRSNRPALLNI